MGTWPGRFTWQSAVGHVVTRGGNIYTGPIVLCAAGLAVLLVIGGVELNPGPVDNIVQVRVRSSSKVSQFFYWKWMHVET
jgi:hypothetical protein